MQGNHETDYLRGLLTDPYWQYLAVIWLAAWGGMVNYISKIRQGHVTQFSLVELVGELATSGFSGVLAYWVCIYAGIGWPLNAIVIGVSGHMGSRTIYLIEYRIQAILERHYGTHSKDKERKS